MSSSPPAPGSPTQIDQNSWQEKLKRACLAKILPKPDFRLMSDRRGGRTAWSCVVTVGDNYRAEARYWYNGHYNAYEDAAEVLLNIFDKRSKGEQQSPTSPQISSQIPSQYSGSDDFSNYTTTASLGGAVRAGGGGGSGSYTYGSIGDAIVGQGLGGGPRHTHSHSLAHGSQTRGAASFVSNYGG